MNLNSELSINRIYNLDFRVGIKKIPDESIDLIITDPPYGLNSIRITNDESLKTYYDVLPESYRVLKQNTFFVTFFSTKFFPYVFKNNPFEYFWNIVLYIPNGRVNSPIGFTKHMSCIIFKKGNPKIKKRCKDIFVDTPTKMIEPDEGFINHPTPKPKTFITELLKMFSNENDLILDPFMGSGSTAMACKLTNRNYLGFEIETEFYNLSLNRIEKYFNK